MFDPDYKVWVIKANITRELSRKFERLFGRYTHWLDVSEPSKCQATYSKFESHYEEKMTIAREGCELPDSLLNTIRRVSDIELREHDRDLQEMKQAERKWVKEQNEAYESVGDSGLNWLRREM